MEEHRGYEIKCKRLYRDGTEELITDPAPHNPFRVAVSPDAKVARFMELLSRGERKEIIRERLHFSFAVHCLLNELYVDRGYCKHCFYRDICAFPKHTKWFLAKEPLRRHAQRILQYIKYNR